MKKLTKKFISSIIGNFCGKENTVNKYYNIITCIESLEDKNVKFIDFKNCIIEHKTGTIKLNYSNFPIPIQILIDRALKNELKNSV